MDAEVIKSFLSHGPWAIFCLVVWWHARLDRNKADEQRTAYGERVIGVVVENTKVMQAVTDSVDVLVEEIKDQHRRVEGLERDIKGSKG